MISVISCAVMSAIVGFLLEASFVGSGAQPVAAWSAARTRARRVASDAS